MTIPQASKSDDLSDFSLIAMTSADALFDKENFRSDERAFQFLDSLRSACDRVVVQTHQAGHQVFSMNDVRDLLPERKEFSLPPFTRLLDIRKASAVSRISIPLDSNLAGRKAEIVSECKSRRGHFVIDVDPV